VRDSPQETLVQQHEPTVTRQPIDNRVKFRRNKQPFDLNFAEIRALLQASADLVKESRELRERTRDLVQESADLREFLREPRLRILRQARTLARLMYVFMAQPVFSGGRPCLGVARRAQSQIAAKSKNTSRATTPSKMTLLRCSVWAFVAISVISADVATAITFAVCD
jgi:hypothetical protein